jgi:hypothetical protein
MLASSSWQSRAAVAFGLVATAIAASPARTTLANVATDALALRGPEVVPGNPHNPANRLVRDAVPSLSANDTQTAIELATDDPNVKRLLHGAQFHVERTGPWTTSGAAEELIGAALFVTLDQPATLSGTWQTAKYDARMAHGPHYREQTSVYTAFGVRELLIQVDLSQRKVASVMPLAYRAIRR